MLVGDTTMCMNIWLEIFTVEDFSKYNQNNIIKVVIGSAAIKPPMRSLILAISVTITMIDAVIKTLKNKYNMFIINL